MDLTQADVAVTMDPGDYDLSPQDRMRTYPSISFGDGSKTYPTYGVPLPDAQKLGMRLGEMKRLNITQPPDGIDYRHDKTVRTGAPNGTIRIYRAGVELGNVAVPALTLDLEVLGR